ncbi:MAG: glycine cleavage system protein GcvH [Anaerolineales bacterium]|nr:glycine cleavage system protein GcvH [Anaerolineales bacterium]MCB8954359.1 glycine cleavage system protein GcvH [Ardenticatenales bacterium]
MTKILPDLLYTEDDEWVRVDGSTGVIGITDFAQDALSDIVYLELPAEGDTFAAGDAFGVVESVKAASDLYMPIAGTITAVNEDLIDAPEKLNADPYGAWLVQIDISDPGELDGLMDATAYQAHCDARH